MNGVSFPILIVEDDPDDREIIDEAFVQLGYAGQVKKFINGAALLHYLETVEPMLYPQLIVLDNSLPGLDASALLKLLKENASYASIPVIIYSTLITDTKQKEMLRLGAECCLRKGQTIQEILSMASFLKEKVNRQE